MQTTESIAALTAALAKAQAEMENAPLNRENPHFKSKYADLAAIRNATVPALSKHGLAVVQFTEISEGGMILRTRLAHSSGEWIESTYPIALDKPQPMGSALTYGKRYCWSAMCGIAAEEDDDGNATNNSDTSKPKPAPRSQPAQRSQGNGNGTPPATVDIQVPDRPGLVKVPGPPEGGNMAQVWRAWSTAMANVITSAPSVAVLDIWLTENKVPLDSLRHYSATGTQWADALAAKAEERRKALTNDPRYDDARKEDEAA